MTFYHRTVYPSSSINQLVLGHFLDEKKEDIIVSTGRILKLLRFEPDNTSQSIQTLISLDINDVICSLSKFRKKNYSIDWLIITTENGNLIILSVNAEQMAFKRLNRRTYKDKTPRKVPVTHLAVDSQGRAFITAAVEEVKMFYLFHGVDDKQLKCFEISKKNLVIFDIAFVDINSDSFIIAYLACIYGKVYNGRHCCISEEPKLFFSEIKEGKETEIKCIKGIKHSNSLISVPGERGVLVCAENLITYYSMDSSPKIKCSIPKRITDPLRNVIFVCSANFSDKKDLSLQGEQSNAIVNFESPVQYNKKNSIYYLAQTEQGDIFKIQLLVNELGVREIILTYFITLPVASALCTLESGYLFVASEFRDHYVYKISDIEKHARFHSSFSSSLAIQKGKSFFFLSRKLNIAPVAEIKSMSPAMQVMFSPLPPMKYRMSLTIGQASVSELKISERDVSFQFRAKIQKKRNETPMNMWAFKGTPSISMKLDLLVVISFKMSTAVYVLETKLPYLKKKGRGVLLATKTNTLCCAKTDDDVIVQVCPEGICLIKDKKNNLVRPSSDGNLIVAATMNKKTLIVAYEDNHLEQFEITELANVTDPKIPRRLLDGLVTCMLLTDESVNEQLLAVGVSLPSSSSSKEIVNIYEVHLFIVNVSETRWLCKLNVEESPYSFLFININSNHLFLLVGSENGTVLTIDVETTMIETTKQYELKVMKAEEIGTQDVKLIQVPALGKRCILAISDHSWFKETIDGDFFQLKVDVSPCICVVLESQTVATVLDDSLRLLILENIYPKPSLTIPLEYTPKNFVVDSHTGTIFIIETDKNSYTEETREKKRKELEMQVAAARNPELASSLSAVEMIPKAWASLIRVVKLFGQCGIDVSKIPLIQNEAALSLCSVNQGFDNLLLVGLAKGFNLSEPSIYTFRILGQTNKLLHKTPIKSAPTAMCCYEGKVLIGIGKKLALYRLKPVSYELELVCEEECVSNSITTIYPAEKRILVCDSKVGISYLFYDSDNGSLHLLEKNLLPIEVTAACIISGDRMIRATMSRDLFIFQLGALEERRSLFGLNEPPVILSKEKLLGCFHVGEIVTSIQILRGFCGESETVVYTSLSGSIGFLTEVKWGKDAELLDSLYTSLQKTARRIDKTGHHFLTSNSQFRSRHYLCENVIDGNYIDHFPSLEVGMKLCVCWKVKKGSFIRVEKKLKHITREIMLDFPF